MIQDPDRTPIPSGGDARAIAKAAIQVADMNALIILGNWCSYDNVRLRYLSGNPAAQSMEPRCLALREYLTKQKATL